MKEEELLNLELTRAKYEGTLLGKVGGPDGPETIVTRWKMGENEAEVNLIMEVGETRQLLYDMLQAMQHMDPVSKELFQSFKKVFEDRRKCK